MAAVAAFNGTVTCSLLGTEDFIPQVNTVIEFVVKLNQVLNKCVNGTSLFTPGSLQSQNCSMFCLAVSLSSPVIVDWLIALRCLLRPGGWTSPLAAWASRHPRYTSQAPSRGVKQEPGEAAAISADPGVTLPLPPCSSRDGCHTPAMSLLSHSIRISETRRLKILEWFGSGRGRKLLGSVVSWVDTC